MADKMLIDVTRLASRALEGRLPTGVDRVSLAYLAHFREQARALVRFGGRWVVLSDSASARLFDELLAQSTKVGLIIRWSVGVGYALNWATEHSSALLLNAGHSGLDQSTYGIETKRRNLRPVFFLHDLIPITHPEYSRPGEEQKHRQRLTTMLSVGRGLIMNSADTRRALEDFAREQGASVPPCVVAPLAPAHLPAPSTIRPLNKAYFVILGTIEPRKNHLLLLHLWRQLVEALGDAAPRLVVIGQRGWECEQVVDLLDRCEALRGFVIERQGCDDAELATWLYYARALLFPSFTEGFGIPLIEALMLGVPVIASDLPVFHEVAGEIPEYLDPLDGPGWKRLILDYTDKGSSRRADQLARMQGYAAPTWERHFEVVDTFLEELNGRA